MTIHVYRAQCAEARAQHEARMLEMERGIAATAGRMGRVAIARRGRERAIRSAVDEAARHWLAAAVEMISWGLR